MVEKKRYHICGIVHGRSWRCTSPSRKSCHSAGVGIAEWWCWYGPSVTLSTPSFFFIVFLFIHFICMSLPLPLPFIFMLQSAICALRCTLASATGLRVRLAYCPEAGSEYVERIAGAILWVNSVYILSHIPKSRQNSAKILEPGRSMINFKTTVLVLWVSVGAG